METKEIVQKLVNSLVEAGGYAYASGYLESTLVHLIEKYVKGDIDKSMLHIQLLGEAIEAKLKKDAA